MTADLTREKLAARDVPERVYVRERPNGALGLWHDATSSHETAAIANESGSRNPFSRYVLATPAALAASPEGQALIREAEARVAGRALDIITSGTFDASDPRIDALADLAEAAAIRGETP